MTQLINKIRYIHRSEQIHSIPRITVAYHRDEYGVSFAWTEVYHKDNYCKQIGREVSESRLKQHIPAITAGVTFIDRKAYVGNVSAADILKLFDHILADSLIARMTAMDLKHSTISNIVVDFIQSKIMEEQY